MGRAALDVLRALLWAFHNARSGCCFPSYETIAVRAGCARSTVAEAIKALEFAGVLTWQNRITQIRECCTDLFACNGWRWRVIRTSNACSRSRERRLDTIWHEYVSYFSLLSVDRVFTHHGPRVVDVEAVRIHALSPLWDTNAQSAFHDVMAEELAAMPRRRRNQ